MSLISAFNALLNPTVPNLYPGVGSTANSTPATTSSQMSPPVTTGWGPLAPKTAPATPSLAWQTPTTTMPNLYQPNMATAGSTTPTSSSVVPPAPSQTITASTPQARPAVPQTSPFVTTPSGAVVNSSTGGLVSGGTATPASPSASASFSAPAAPAVSDTSGFSGSPQYAAGTGGGATSPSVPSLAGFGSGAGGYNSMITTPYAEGLFKKYEDSLQMTPEEQAAQDSINRLSESANKAFTNTEGQAIPLPFITGQQMNIQKSEANLAQPLQARLALLQAKRQLAGTASKAALDRVDSQLAAERELAKPINTTFGSTLSRYNPQTGKYESLVNPFGNASDTASGSGLSTANVQEILGQLAAAGITPTRYSIPGYIAAVQAGVPIQSIINNKAANTFINSADTQKFIANSNTALNTINDPAQGIKALSNKVNRTAITVANNGLLTLKAGVSDPDTANFVQQANILADEVSKLLGSGQGSDFAIQLGQALVNPNYSQDTFNATMDNLAGRVQNKVDEYIKQGTGTSSTGSGSPSSSQDPLNLGI